MIILVILNQTRRQGSDPIWMISCGCSLQLVGAPSSTAGGTLAEKVGRIRGF